MGSTSRFDWTDEATILRDLRYAQGWVPGGIKAFVANGQQPPPPEVDEETEEEYYSQYATGVDHSSGPDLTLIKTMLDMVNNEEEDSDEDEFELEQIEISKTKLPAPVFVRPIAQKPVSFNSQQAPAKSLEEPGPSNVNKPRCMRNVAIASILAMNEVSEDENEDMIPVKLSKAEDFVPKPRGSGHEDGSKKVSRRQEGEEKVTNWLQAQESACMFKKKSPVKSPKKNDASSKPDLIEDNETFMLKKKSPSPSPVVEAPKRVFRLPSEWKPTSFAREYYLKCVERVRIRELIKQDIWSKAEEQMKEIDNLREEERIKKAREEEMEENKIMDVVEYYRKQREDDDSPDYDTFDEPGIGQLLLPSHRHLLSEDCVVCEVLVEKKTEDSDNKDNCATITCETEEKIIEKPIKSKMESNSSDEEPFVCVPSLVDNLNDYDLIDFKCTPPLKMSSFEELDLLSSQ